MVKASAQEQAIQTLFWGLVPGSEALSHVTDARRFFCKPLELKSSKLLVLRKKRAVDGFHQPFK